MGRGERSCQTPRATEEPLVSCGHCREATFLLTQPLQTLFTCNERDFPGNITIVDEGAAPERPEDNLKAKGHDFWSKSWL